MDADEVIMSWRKKNFAPFYWFEGEESYYIDKLMQYAEHELLSPEEASFNLSVFYGKDANWAEILNVCKKYPMFSDRQVVLLKEAQQMKDIEKLQPYFEAPLASTVFIVSFKEKTLDKRTVFSKTVSKKGERLEFKKLYDNQVPGWIEKLVSSRSLRIKPKAVNLLFEHIGNDLSRIANEIDKLTLNLSGKSEINEDDIEKFIGISKEYNIFELSAAIAYRDMPKAVRILNYVHSNPKPFPIQLTLPALYSNVSRVYSALGQTDQSDAGLKTIFGHPEAIKNARVMMNNYGMPGVEKILLLLHEYNLKGVGIDDGKASHAELLKELVVRIMAT
jgi:DNA polymerase-3 subunit delta